MKRNEFLKRLLGAGAAAIASKAIVTSHYEKKVGGKKETHFTEKNTFNGKEVSGICSFKCSG